MSDDVIFVISPLVPPATAARILEWAELRAAELVSPNYEVIVIGSMIDTETVEVSVRKVHVLKDFPNQTVFRERMHVDANPAEVETRARALRLVAQLKGP